MTTQRLAGPNARAQTAFLFLLPALLPQEFTERYMRVAFTENRTKYIKYSVGALQSFLAQDMFERGEGDGGGSQQGDPRVTRSSGSASQRLSMWRDSMTRSV